MIGFDRTAPSKGVNGRARGVARPLGALTLRGKSAATEVFEPLAAENPPLPMFVSWRRLSRIGRTPPRRLSWRSRRARANTRENRAWRPGTERRLAVCRT
jgi:hypothetical protein